MARMVDVGAGSLWVEQRGQGPDVLLLAGLADPLEVWSAQLDGLADRYRLTAFDNRCVGRSPMGDDTLSVPQMADDAAAVMRALGVKRAHVMGYSGGSLISQELALRHPDRVRSLVLVSTFAGSEPYFSAMLRFWDWMVDRAPSERAMLEAFFLWIYTPRSFADGSVERFIQETIDFPHKQTAEGFKRQVAAFGAHDARERLHAITAPTLVLAGEVDRAAPPRLGRMVAERIPGARFEILAGEAHQPFQEVPAVFNARVERFWREH